jgi:hypothetical protein
MAAIEHDVAPSGKPTRSVMGDRKAIAIDHEADDDLRPACSPDGDRGI